MALFLKAISGLYLILIWASVAMALSKATPPFAGALGGGEAANLLILLVAVALSIPAAILFGFAQIVEDVRAMRKFAKSQNDHLTAMRRYYEPNGAR